ncbi:extracellular solute-binding protein [Luteipulveratus sp. YIM 133132]|uniref:Extracellular solute-binding protein n=1 Tax=Luteipulveratus flavus TaxID=3031728 RepID=A0ABT6C6W7_9MICO|nr:MULTISPECIES: extracellular solute-binding protein [unclassified Luteipulveratus]MDE9365222.1 extracellular solute-binding protein [Luteipulveratus sp. YIM 133132]MDF8264441.1 extracellular solute-binding protein [Luteipulveratus sp. YIM 133296]
MSAAIALVATGLSACAGSSARPADRLLVWSLEAQPDRVAVQQRMLAAFTKATGIRTELVAVDEGQLPQLIASAAQTGDLPDVVGSLPLGFVRQLDHFDVLDRSVATQVLDRLGRGTFAPRTVQMVTEGRQALAVPSDGWAQVLVYRKDLFQQAGLPAPTTYDAMMRAATRLTTGKQYGISIATDPADVFTQQTFESLALGNGCQLIDAKGTAQIDSPRCLRTWRTYRQLAGKVSPEGLQDVDSTRASYFAGQSAMVLWSTFILDELAGLRNDAVPTCGPCKRDKTWLAKHSGVVTAITGPDGGSGGFGEVSSWAAIKGGNTKGAAALMGYALGPGYTTWLGMAPEGKFPARLGPQPGSRQYVQDWSRLKSGVDTKKVLSTVYDAQTMQQVTGVWDHLDRWAIPENQGAVLGPTSAELPIAKAVAEMSNGSQSADGAARDARDAVDEIATSVS